MNNKIWTFLKIEFNKCTKAIEKGFKICSIVPVNGLKHIKAKVFMQ